MTSPRELDTRKDGPRPAGPAGLAAVLPATTTRNQVTGAPADVRAPATAATPFAEAAGLAAAAGAGNLIDRALAFVQRNAQPLGFAPSGVVEFAPDPAVYRTSSGAAAVHLHQRYRGLPVFQMTRTVRFDPHGQAVDAAGDSASLPPGINTAPRLSATAALLKAAEHLASTGAGQTFTDRFKQTYSLPTIDVAGFKPEVLATFPLPPQPTVFAKGPFETAIPAYLQVFYQPQPRLAWHFVLTFPNYEDQYRVLVSADESPGEILYCKSILHRAAARGRVFQISPGNEDRKVTTFPRALGDYPPMPAMPLAGFPGDWVDVDSTVGNNVRALLNFTNHTLQGVVDNGVVVFDPADGANDDAKLLNIFYFCNYMHDFLYILGFNEETGNFQQVKHVGLGGDPVLAHAHSGPVSGTANMSTPPEGQSPVMNMGLVTSSGRHTAFDSDVVFHEYTHGLTNRLVGGPMDTLALEKLQSGGMGEGWSDFFAMTIQNFFRNQEKFVTGDWVVKNDAGIRRAPYDDAFPFKFGDLAPSPEVHDIGEVWCATLLMMARRIRAAVGNDQAGYRLSWTMVVDALKLTPANPTFLQARDAILRALDDLRSTGRVTPATFQAARKAAWEAFAHFGMGVNAVAGDAASVDGITPDTTLPPDLG